MKNQESEGEIKKNNQNKENEQDLAEEAEFQKKVQEKLDHEISENSTPLWLTKLYVEKPIIPLSVCAFIFILCAVLTVALEMVSMAPSHTRDFLIWDNERVDDYDMLMEGQQQLLKSQQSSQIPIQTININNWTTFIILKGDKNVLTQESIRFLYGVEQEIKKMKNYDSFCIKSQTDNTEGCAANALFSITSMFQNPAEVTQSEIDAVLDNISNDDQQWLMFKGLFGNDFSSKNQNSKYIRSMFFFGGPISIDGTTYKDIFDRSTEQDDHFDDLSQLILDHIEDEDLVKPGAVKILGFSTALSGLQTQNVANGDFMWALGSIVFVLIYMSIHLKSFFMSSMSMLSIIFSFPITLVIFNGILRITYFSSLHILVIFIVLGIAADNVFVFIDAWNQTDTYKQLTGDYNKRMAFTFRRASKAMLATSSTTAAAFFSTGLSPIMPISSFGFFAGILIPVNFILVITFFPCILIVYEKYTKNMCVSKQKDTNTKNTRQKSNSHNVELNISKLYQEQLKAKEHKLVQFFDKEFNDFIFKFRYQILAVFLLWTIFATVRAMQLPALSEPEQFLPDEHEATIAQNAMRYDFHMSGNSDTGIKVYQFWGIESINKEDSGMWDPTDLGEIKWDSKFDLSPTINQQFLYDYCIDMQTNVLVQDGLINCFMIDFYNYVVTDSNGNTIASNFPIPQSEFLTKFIQFTEQDPKGQSYYNENLLGIINGELKYVVIKLSAHGVPFTPYSVLNPIFEQWDDHIKSTNKNAPEGLKNSRQTALINWVFMITEKAFSTSALEGTGISIAFAFIVLLMTTHNIVISLYSILTIVGIVMSVIAVMQLSGWELGVAESIAIVILIGMSVDYVVHLANHYVESVYPDRFRKIKISLKDLGISIISGATTTIGSGIFLFFATMIIFNKFAILIVSTILFSLAYALIFFSSLVHAFGPQGNTGNILVLFQSCGKQKKVNNSNNASDIQDDNKNENNNNQNIDANIKPQSFVQYEEKNQDIKIQDIKNQDQQV